MGLKLRRIVTDVHTPRGVLVRLGANVVAITGVGVHKAFDLLRENLDGNWTRDQICAAVPVERQAALGRLIDALEKGQMVYSTDAGESGSSVPRAPDDELRLARIEASRDRPVHLFDRARGTPITISGPEWLAAELAEACAEAGVTNVARVGVSTPEAEARVREEAVRVVAIDLTGSPESGDPLLGTDAAPTVPLIVYADKILAGPFEHGWPTACVRCLVAAHQDTPPKAPVARPQLRLGAALAARVLVQRWLDLRTGVVPAESAALFYTIDLHSREIALHPLPPNPVCPHCRAIVSRSAGRRHRDVTDQGSAETVLPRTHKYLTDPTTGIFKSIQEGDLVQLPLRQSAASWRDPLDRTREMWTTEAAADIRSARAAAGASALEFYVSDLLDAPGESSLAVLGLGGPLAPDRLVASGYTLEQARARALFRTVAYDAQRSGSWRRADVHDVEGWARASLVMAYLEDTGHGSRLTVERHRPHDDDAVRVRRFSYDGTLVSVVAGTEEPDIWTVGLAAVWLHIAATDPAQRPQGIRRVAVYRDAVSSERHPGSIEDAIERRFGPRLELVPLTVPTLSPLAPLCFVAATLRSATPFDRTNSPLVRLEELSVGDGVIAGGTALSSVDASGHNEP